MQKYKSNITSTSGAAIRGVPVLVIAEDGDNATLFLDRAGTVPAPNPLTTGPDGVFYFYAVNGRYSLRTTVDGVTITDDDVVLMMDPAEITVAGPIAEAVAAAQAAATAAEFAVEASGIPELVAAAQNAVVDANSAVSQASTAASNAATSRSGADSARDAAVVAKNAAEAALDSFDDRYLGAKAVAPTLDNDGNALLTGALYWDTALPGMRSWNGSAWATLPAATAASISNTPAGSIAATTVQGAINELDAEKLSKAGGVLTGNLDVPSLNGGQLAGIRRRNLNGACTIAQNGTSFTGLASGAHFTIDGFSVSNSSDAVLSASKSTDVPANSEFSYSHAVTVTTADAAIAATQFADVHTTLEGYSVRDFVGRDFTISFWVRSAKTGVHSIALRNATDDKNYVTTYIISAANTWERKVVTVVGGLPNSGTWNFSSGVGLRVEFSLACGSTYQTATTEQWIQGPALAKSGSVNFFDTAGNLFAITGLQIERGNTATPFEHWGFHNELAMAKRYWQWHPTIIFGGNNAAGNEVFFPLQLPVSMRISPTVIFSPAYSNASGISTSHVSPDVIGMKITITSSGYGYTQTGVKCDARLP